MNKISLVGYVAGIVIIILAIQRWWFVYYDPSTMLIYISLGILVLADSYILNWMKCSIDDSNKEKERVNIKFGEIEKIILAISNWNERQKIRKEFIK